MHVVDVPKSIDATGHQDVQQALEAFIASVPNRTTVRFPAGGKYRLERTLYIRNRRNLTFDGNGATIFATERGNPTRSQIVVRRGKNIIFRDINVRGVNPNGGVSEGAYVRRLETQHGFNFEGTQGGELDHVRVTDVYGDCVYIGRDKRKQASRDIWIHDSTCARNGRQGISVTAGENIVIERNHFNQTRRATVDLEPNAHSWRVSNVFILDNTVGPGRLLFVASHGQGPVDNVVISGNVLHNHDLTIDVLPPEGARRSNWVVTDNVSDTVVRHRPLRFFDIDGLVVKNNTQRVSGDAGLVLTDDCGTQVAGNHFGGQFGGGGVTRHGRSCAAPLAVPVVPALRGRVPGTTPTTTPRTGPPPSRPGTTPPPAGHRPGASSGSEAGRIVGAAVLFVLAALAIAVFVRRRRRHSA
jgi:hypothetical protein